MRPANNVRRPRGRPNRKQHGSPRNQTFDSHGPDVRVRGNATQIYDKYVSLARDAAASGDRVAAEGYYQFAEHYFRIINDSTDPRRANPQQGRPEQNQGQGQDQRGEREQSRNGGDSSPGEQPPVDMEQPFIDQSQAQSLWPPQVDAAPSAPDAKNTNGANEAEGPGELNGDAAASAEPVKETGEEATEEGSSRPRRASRGRGRGRRNANGANRTKDEQASESEEPSASPDEGESEGLAT